MEGRIMAKVETYYKDYGARARELSVDGKKVIGYACSFVPLELITAAGCIPFRIRGDVHEPITKGDALLEAIVCPYYRSCFDLAVKGRYNFLSGMVIPHGCDSMVRSYPVWQYSLELPYFHFLNTPTVCDPSSFEFFNEELKHYKRILEEFIGREITNEDLSEAIYKHNENRDKARTLYEFRKQDPPLISGTELIMVLTAGSAVPIDEANALFDEVIAAIGERKEPPLKKGPRILIDGACIDNFEVVRLVEESGANVVADTVCNGTRDYFPPTDTSGDLIAALGRRYLDKINCPKTYRKKTADSWEDDIAERFGDIGAYAKEFNVDGAILYVYKYCDPFGFEVPARKAYYESIHVPVLHLEDIYSAGTIGQVKTRIQAFLEMIG